jgi:hypothetical protein
MATTTGFVQRVSVLSGGLAACVWIGPDPGSTEAFAVEAASTEAEAFFGQSLINMLVEAQCAGREVAVTHDSGSAVVTSVSTPTCDSGSTPLQVDAIEVTQAMQDLGLSIPLFAGKRTVARVYLSHYASPGITVRGQISVRRGPTDPPALIASENVVVLDPADAGDIPAKRDDETRSLNFVLPSSLEGPMHISLDSITNEVTGSPVGFGCSRQPTIWFHRSPPMRLRVLGMRYTQNATTHVPTDLDFDLVESWLHRAMPAGDVQMTSALVDATAAVPFGCGDINAQVAAIRALDVSSGTDARTHYYGLVSDGGFFMRGCTAGIPTSAQPETVASGPTGPATWGWDVDGSYGDWYTGHELGHTYGRRHPGFCGETQSDLDNYPFENGQLANSDSSFAGFDVGDPLNGLAMAALPGTQWHDVMTYCSLQWLCAYTYLGVRRRLADEDTLSSGGAPGPPAPGPSSSGGRPDGRYPRRPAGETTEGAAVRASERVLVSVVSTVNLTRRKGRVEFVNPLERGVPTTLSEPGEAVLRVRGGDGEILADYPVDVRLNSELAPGDDREGIVDAVLLVSTSARSIELVVDDEVLDTHRVGGGPPTVGSVSVDDRGPEATMRVSASVVSPVEAHQTYTVQVSTDRGRTWQTLAVGRREPSTTIDRRQFRPGQEVMVRVLATDGLSTSVVASESFRM